MGIKLPQYTIEEYKKQPSFLLKMVTPIFVIVSFLRDTSLMRIYQNNPSQD